MTTDAKINQLLGSGAMRDLGWPQDKARQNARRFLARWERQQEGMGVTMSPVSYLDLQEMSHVKAQIAIARATQRDPETFTVIPTAANHHLIQDDRGVTLGYRYRVPMPLLTGLATSTANLPATKMTDSVRGRFRNRHYAVWRDSAKLPYLNTEFKRDLPASQVWLDDNRALFDYLSNGLRMIHPPTYARLSGAKSLLEEQMGLTPLGGVWYGVAINQELQGTGGRLTRDGRTE